LYLGSLTTASQLGKGIRRVIQEMWGRGVAGGEGRDGGGADEAAWLASGKLIRWIESEGLMCKGHRSIETAAMLLLLLLGL
jgi:hypothetical protein